MKHYIEYYQRYYNGTIAPCVGTNSIICLDNRLNKNNMIKKGFEFKYIPAEAIGFKLCVGRNILFCKPISELYLINNK